MLCHFRYNSKKTNLRKNIRHMTTNRQIPQSTGFSGTVATARDTREAQRAAMQGLWEASRLSVLFPRKREMLLSRRLWKAGHKVSCGFGKEETVRLFFCLLQRSLDGHSRPTVLLHLHCTGVRDTERGANVQQPFLSPFTYPIVQSITVSIIH